MKTISVLCGVSLLLLAGCGKNSDSSGGSSLTAPVDYLKAAGKAEQKAEKTVDVAAINQALQMFNVQEGRFPKDLNELVEKKYMPRLPVPPVGSKLVYDATAGTVKVVRQ
jgi:hypothetical protein